MIDLHSHILSGLDDGASSIEISIEMARLAIADGTTHMACTPHVLPGKYPNTSATILPAIRSLQAMLQARHINLKLVEGADVHVAWELPERLAAGEIPTLNNSRYFLLEPPHEILPPKLDALAKRLIDAGFVPIITHPERLAWIKSHYDVIERLHAMGCPLQLTADSVLGRFGPTIRDYSIRMIEEGIVSLFASDAHSSTWRKPGMSEAYRLVSENWGKELAGELFVHRPRTILMNEDLPVLPKGLVRGSRVEKKTGTGPKKLFRRIFGGQ